MNNQLNLNNNLLRAYAYTSSNNINNHPRSDYASPHEQTHTPQPLISRFPDREIPMDLFNLYFPRG